MAMRASILLPLLLIAALVAVFLLARPLDYLTEGIPPVERLTVENVTLGDPGIQVVVRASGSQPIVVAQVQVDGAFWQFTQSPAGAVGYLQSAILTIPYPWIAGETHHLVFVTNAGATFEHTIDVAVATPGADGASLAGLALMGAFVGIVPILIGYGFYPALMSFGVAGRQFAMALTIGLLVFLLVDALGEGLEIAAKAAPGFKAGLVVWISALLTCLLLLAVGRRGGRPPEGTALAFYIALGIGMHNLGEGLAIGASIAVGEVALASFLVLGFALHNVTEGIAISMPLRREAMSPWRLAGLAVLAGGPAVLGTMSGAVTLSPLWTALAFGIGSGAIAQVIIEVGGSLVGRAATQGDKPALPTLRAPWFSAASLTGFVTGVGLMYGTTFIIQG
ncbi:MAG: ZIP family metal transporter [Alphaproteobacteria bacterium]